MVLACSVVFAQAYPARPVRVVTGAPGSTAEFAARSLAQGLSARLGQPAVVDPRAAGGGTVFGEIVAKAQPDGYTLLVIGSSFWVGPLFRKAPYDVISDFAPIAIVADSPNVLVVHPSLPVASVKDLIELARAKPGALNYSTSGIGASPHLAAELFKAMAGVDIAHIPFKGAGASVIGVMSAQVQLSFASVASVAPHVQSARVRGIAVTGARPFALFPELPTVAATVPGYEAGGATGFFAPAKTPAAVIARLNREAAIFLRERDVKEKFLNLGVETVGSSPEQLTATIKSDTIKWANVIKHAGIRPE
jgi:tripartite-type tricarboxylate transporter receptor subunit TctC